MRGVSATLLVLSACATPGGAPYDVAGTTLSVRAVADEPQPTEAPVILPSGGPGYLPTAPLGAPGPALRVAGTINRPPAIEAARRFCASRGSPLDDAPAVRYDDPTAEFVVYADC